MSKPRIGVVTVTYNSSVFLNDFVTSCAAQNRSDFKIYCIDNNSDDDTQNILKNICNPYWVVTLNENNVGVAEGNNQGIVQALKDGCEWILLLNNDTSFPPDFISKLIASSVNQRWQVIVPKIHFDSPVGYIWYGGGGFNPKKGHTGYHTGIGQPDHGQFDTAKLVDYSPTCAMLIHRSVFGKVGLMDESYFVYFDDTDFCWRLKQANISIGYTPATSLVHKVGGSTGGAYSPFTARITSRNRLYYLKKNFGALSAILWMPVFLIYYLSQFTVRRDFACLKASFKGTFEYFHMVPREPCAPIKVIS